MRLHALLHRRPTLLHATRRQHTPDGLRVDLALHRRLDLVHHATHHVVLVKKADLALVRMHIHVNQTRVDPHRQEAQRILVAALGVGVAAVVVLLQNATNTDSDPSVLDESSVHEEDERQRGRYGNGGLGGKHEIRGKGTFDVGFLVDVNLLEGWTNGRSDNVGNAVHQR